MNPHYYSPKQDSPLRPKTFNVFLRELEFTFKTGSGVFSRDHVDPGTRLLVESVEVRDGSRILDLGCGYGPVGISIARSIPSAKVVLTDVNERAASLAKENAKLNGVDVKVVSGNLYDSVEGEFDMILVNLPMNAGKVICHAMMDGSVDHLKKGGAFVFVARHKKGGKTYSEYLENIYGNIEVLKRGSGYRVYKSVKQ